MAQFSEDYHIPPLQEKIILHLANKGPDTMYSTAKQVSADYKNVHTNFETMLNRNWIKKVGLKEGTKYELYWLDTDGFSLAIGSGFNVDLLKATLIDEGISDFRVDFILDFVPRLSKSKIMKYVLRRYKRESPFFNYDTEDSTIFFETLKRHPKVAKQIRQAYLSAARQISASMVSPTKKKESVTFVTDS